MNNQIDSGFTLIEVIITVAIIAIISSIAIPAYQGYITTARANILQQNIESIRLYLQDYQLDNGGNYEAGTFTLISDPSIEDTYGWSPETTAENTINYTVVSTASTFTLLAADTAHADNWMFCDTPTNCCSSHDSGATKTACP